MVHFKTCLVLKLCDEDKKHQELAKINKINAAAAATATAKNKAASNARTKADEVINLEESPIVMTADGSMQKASECVTLPPNKTSPRAMKTKKGKGKAKKPLVPVTDAQVDQFQLQINEGRFGRGKKLHDHGFELDKFGIV